MPGISSEYHRRNMNLKPEAVVLVDPLSSACELANYISERSLVCVRIDTIPDRARTGPLGPYLPVDTTFPDFIRCPIDYDPFLQTGEEQPLVAKAEELAGEIRRKWNVKAVIPGSEVGVQLSDFLARC